MRQNIDKDATIKVKEVLLILSDIQEYELGKAQDETISRKQQSVAIINKVMKHIMNGTFEKEAESSDINYLAFNMRPRNYVNYQGE